MKRHAALKFSQEAPYKSEEGTTTMTTIDEQIRADWKLYYEAISAGHVEVARRIAARATALVNAQIARKSTSRMLAAALAI